MRYHVQVGTTSIYHRDLNGLAQRLQTAIQDAGYVRDPTITSQLLTRRLVMSAYIDSDDAGEAMAIGKSVLLSHPSASTGGPSTGASASITPTPLPSAETL